MAYVFEGMEGWCSRDVFLIMEHVNMAHNDHNIIGNVAEIGVHHGRFFLFLVYLLKGEEYAFGVDVFENQIENINRSGLGDIVSFAKNFALSQPGKMRVCILKENSLKLKDKPGFFTFNGLKVRLFSVDGGHSYKEAINDLDVAAAVLDDAGVIMMDDFQHPADHQDVYMATLNWLSAHEEYEPFMIGGNKLFICKSKYKYIYDNVPTLTRKEYFESMSHSNVIHRCATTLEKWPKLKLFPEIA